LPHRALSLFSPIIRGQAVSSGGQDLSSPPMKHYPKKAMSPSRYRAANPSRLDWLDVITLPTSHCCASIVPTCRQFGWSHRLYQSVHSL
jgi:hypothetical protein